MLACAGFYMCKKCFFVKSLLYQAMAFAARLKGPGMAGLTFSIFIRSSRWKTVSLDCATLRQQGCAVGRSRDQ